MTIALRTTTGRD